MSHYVFEGLTPVAHPDTFVHPSAVLIDDVIVSVGVYIGPHAPLRGDYGRLVLEAGSNLQDGCIIHGHCDTDTIVHENGRIGHGAILHDCVVGRDALIGMNSVVMDDAAIGGESVVAAMSLVKAGFQGKARQMLVGSPTRVLREVTDQELHWKRLNTEEYQDLAICYHTGLHEALPLTRVEKSRPRLKGTADVKPKSTQQLMPDAFTLIRPTRQSPFMSSSGKLIIGDAYSWRASSAISVRG